MIFYFALHGNLVKSCLMPMDVATIYFRVVIITRVPHERTGFVDTTFYIVGYHGPIAMMGIHYNYSHIICNGFSNSKYNTGELIQV